MTIVTRLRTASAITVASLFVLVVSDCALFGPKVETKSYETADGAVIVETVKLSAIVKAINERERTLTLDPKHGETQTVKASPDMVNFNQIRVGDEVHVELIEALAVSLISGGAAESVGELDAVALAPVGAKPGVAIVSSREVTADIIGIDLHAHRVTLEFIDGSTQSVKVGKHIDLTKVALDDSVRIQITDAVAITITAKTGK
jgi:hypothetical protein